MPSDTGSKTCGAVLAEHGDRLLRELDDGRVDRREVPGFLEHTDARAAQALARR